MTKTLSADVRTKSTIFCFLRFQRFYAYWQTETYFFKHVQRNQKSGTVEEPWFCRPVELPDRNGLVPHEDERYGRHEVRRAAKRVRVRKSQAAHDHNELEAWECAVFLALAAARPPVPGAGERKRGARIALGSEPAQVS